MRLEVDLERAPDSAAEARRAVVEASDHLSRRRLEDAQLLVSELVTNAVRHARLDDGARIHLVIEAGPGGMRIEVSDPGIGFAPVAPSPDPARASGWGLFLVRELSDRWGMDPGPGTRVWFELDGEAA